jgi:hypothetical protein
MLETILILKMYPRFRGDDSGGYSHFHGNDKTQTKQAQSMSHKTGEACPIFMGMTYTNKIGTVRVP